MPTTPSDDVPVHDPQQFEQQYTFCPDCGEELAWHHCPARCRLCGELLNDAGTCLQAECTPQA